MSWVYNNSKNRWEFKDKNTLYTFNYQYNPNIKGWTSNTSKQSYGTRRVKLPNGHTYHFATDGTITDLNIVQSNNFKAYQKQLQNITNRYNPNNDVKLDSIVNLGRLSGYNAKQISALVANAIIENGGDPGKTSNGRTGLFQNGANQCNRVGTTVKSSMAALDEDYKLGRLPWKEEITTDSTDMNGWIPKYLEIFNNSENNAYDIGKAFGLGYERFTKNKEADADLRGRLSQYIHDNILKGK